MGCLDHPLDPRSVIVARLSAAIAVGSASLLGLFGVVALALATPWSGWQKLGLLVGWILLSAGGAAFAYVWPSARYRRIRYRVDEQGLTIRRGILWRTETFVPRSRIQHTDVLQGPLQRTFELATLIVHTAGTQDASVALSGLAYQAALPIRDFLIGGGHSTSG